MVKSYMAKLYLYGKLVTKNQPEVHFSSGAVFLAWSHKAHKMAYFVPPKNACF